MKFLKTKTALFSIAILFSTGLIFATLQLPYLFDNWIQHAFKFPGFDQASSTLQMSKSDLYFQYLHIKTIGLVCLIITFLLVIIGLVTNKLNLSVLGAVALFVPIFGHFTVTMFFLAGLSFLRFLWIPFTGLSPLIMRLGDILLIPNNWIQEAGKLFNVDLQFSTSVIFISSGVLLFVIGVYNWFNTKFNKGNVVTAWTYKISRHPQYLGWIIWSYGLYLLPVDAQKRVWSYHDSLPLLLTIMIIITISLFEELKMTRKYGDEYRKFKARTAFMFPLPDFLKKIIKHPVRLFYGDYELDKKGKILSFIGYYTILLMGASYIFLSIKDPAFSNKLTQARHEKKMGEYIETLKTSENRRAKDIAAMELSNYGDMAVIPLSGMLSECNTSTNNFVIRTLGEIGNPIVCPEIYNAYKENEVELSYELIMAIGKLRCHLFEEELISEIKNPDSKVKSYAAWYLGQIKSQDAVQPLLKNYPQKEKYTQLAFLEAIGKIGDRAALGLLIQELKNEDKEIVEAAIIALAHMGAKETIVPLSSLLNHEDWEIRIYANQAIKNLGK